MAFIRTIPPEQASEALRSMYERQRAHFGYLPNYAMVFCYRPEVMAAWAALIGCIRKHVEPRRFELVTLSAAHALENTYCALAHGKALAELMDAEDIPAIVNGGQPRGLSAAEHEIVRLARKVARDARSVSAGDIARLRDCGLSDAEIFDVVAVTAGRAFFTKILDGLGADADPVYLEMAAPLRHALTVGRPVPGTPPADGRTAA